MDAHHYFFLHAFVHVKIHFIILRLVRYGSSSIDLFLDPTWVKAC